PRPVSRATESGRDRRAAIHVYGGAERVFPCGRAGLPAAFQPRTPRRRPRSRPRRPVDFLVRREPGFLERAVADARRDDGVCRRRHFSRDAHRSTIGFGEALVAVPLLALRIPISVAAPLAVAVSVCVAALIVAQDWRQIEVRSAGWLVASSLFGIPLGLLLLTTASDTLVKLILGLVIAAFAVYSLFAKTQLHLREDHRAWLLGAGFCSGVLGGAYGMNGPPLAIYGALRRWS